MDQHDNVPRARQSTGAMIEEMPASHMRAGVGDSADRLYKEYLKCHLKTKRHYRHLNKSMDELETADIAWQSFLPCAKKKREKIDTAFNNACSQGYTLEASRIVESLNKLDKLLKIVFTADQLLLFNIIPNYEMNFFNRAEEPFDLGMRDPEEREVTEKQLKEAATRLFKKRSKSDIEKNLLKHSIFLLDDNNNHPVVYS